MEFYVDNVGAQYTIDKKKLIKLPSNIEEYELVEGCKSFDNKAFEGCINLININTINDAEDIGKLAFKNCESLESIAFNNVKILKEQTFYNCKALKNIYLNMAEYISDEVFYGCESLESFNVNEKITYISKNSFDNCLKLERFNYYDNNYFNIW